MARKCIFIKIFGVQSALIAFRSTLTIHPLIAHSLASAPRPPRAPVWGGCSKIPSVRITPSTIDGGSVWRRQNAPSPHPEPFPLIKTLICRGRGGRASGAGLARGAKGSGASGVCRAASIPGRGRYPRFLLGLFLEDTPCCHPGRDTSVRAIRNLAGLNRAVAISNKVAVCPQNHKGRDRLPGSHAVSQSQAGCVGT